MEPTENDSRANDWHTLILDTAGKISCADQNLAHLLGVDADGLAGKSVNTVIPDLPFSELTPGYNLAYAIFCGASAAAVRRMARAKNGNGVLVDTVLSGRNINGHRSILLSFRCSRAESGSTC